jgi:hypothetical protein
MPPGTRARAIPAGSTWRWSVPVYVKKIAFLRVPYARPLAMTLRAWRRFTGASRRA